MRNRTRISSLDAFGLRDQRNRIYPALEASDGSTFSLDFTAMGGALDSRFTFSRTSTATLINSSGLMQYADHNLFTNTAWLGSTLPTNWALLIGTGTTTWNADGSVTMTAATDQRPAINHATITTINPGMPHTFGYLATNVSGSPQISQIIDSNIAGETYAINGVAVASTTVVQSNDVVSCTFTPTTTNVAPRIGPGVEGLMSNMSVTASRPQFNVGSSLRPYAANTSTSGSYQVPRFDYDPTTLVPRGLLIEASATNLCLNGSMVYTTAKPDSWNRAFSQCTVASVDSTTFLGQKAWSISATVAEQRDFLEQTITLAANTTYTVSVYLEAVTGTPATFAYMTSLPSGASSGTVINPSAGRVSFTVTVGATPGNGTLRIGIGTALGIGVSANASVRFSHVQVEAGPGTSSYIPTGTSTGQRANESLEITGTNFSSWWPSGLAEWSVYWVGDVVRQNSSSQFIWRAQVSSTARSRALVTSTLGIRANANATDMNPGLNATVNTVFKVAAGFKQENSAVSVHNGTSSASATDAISTVQTDSDRINFNGTSANFMHMRQFKFWPSRLSNAALLALVQ